ncbi:TetR/AcrR family transcriptional regulator [Streptomyces sp. AK02-01A]|uniref:TetR/AcrR family transcriptional regulator n=1 Tax=Streptomyces sp. AK02-01A TaxID=3028648 RepID=UPI0029A85D3B|nr:TetR/AcrR family transcriptional regulator [Streptomyces sp. AK02-01A]MDX3853964.1 TetR/AcrR family transcriptional regulator [Streptomyces sp. AK02-01A]
MAHPVVEKASSKSGVTRDRLLLAAAELMHASGGGSVSTRAICERAGVQAPTLYHHFGSKQGLLDAVVNYGFTQYVEARNEERPGGGGDDPVARIRHGWDDHVRFGLEHPSFYVLLYGQIQQGVPCTLTGQAEAMLLELLTRVARAGGLRVDPAEAAQEIAAANVGVTLSLIARPGATADAPMSRRVRDALLRDLIDESHLTGEDRPLDEGGQAGTDAAPGIGTLAVALSTALASEPSSALSDGEAILLREWLDRLGGMS